MPITYNITPQANPRILSQNTTAVSQLQSFVEVYRGLRDFLDNGGTPPGFDPNDIARWNSEFRAGVVWIGGAPVAINFFEELWGMGTPKEIKASDLYIEYNTSIDFNIYAQNAATGTFGTVTNATVGNVVNGNYTGAYAVFSPATGLYTDGGTQCNINIGDEIYLHNDGRSVKVIRIDTTSNYAWQVYVAPKSGTYTINIPALQAMLPVKVQETTGYFDGSNGGVSFHSEYETPGYVKKIQPINLIGAYEVPKNLGAAWQDLYTFPLIFDKVTGQVMDSWDLKAAQGKRQDMVMGTNLKFFIGEEVTNAGLLATNYTQQYNGFEGYMNELWYGGGKIKLIDPSIGFDLDVDYKAMALENDATKLSSEYLMVCAKAFKWAMESRAQDMFQSNSGAYSFETFKRGMLAESYSTDIIRMGINSLKWGMNSLFIKEEGAFSDSRYLGPNNSVFPNTAIIMPGYGQVDSNGQPVGPVEFYKPVGTTEMAGWNENLVDMQKAGFLQNKWQGSITNTIMMAVHGIENVWGVFPNQ